MSRQGASFELQEVEKLFGPNIANKLKLAHEMRRQFRIPPATQQPTPSATDPSRPIPENCLKCGNVPPRIDVEITPGSTLRSIVGYIFSPTNFYLIPYEQYNELEGFQERLNKYVEETLDAKGNKKKFCPGSNVDLIPGIYVYAKVPKIEGQDKELEWHRAKVIDNPAFPRQVSQAEENGKLTVRLVDFGDLRKVDIKDIRYMSKLFEPEFPIIGVSCEIGFVDDPYFGYMDKLTDIPNLKWPPNSTGKFVKYLDKKTLAVTFLSCYVPERADSDSFDPAPETRWSVRINTLVDKDTKLPNGEDPVKVEPNLLEDLHPDAEVGVAILEENVCDHFKQDIEDLMRLHGIKNDLENLQLEQN